MFFCDPRLSASLTIRLIILGMVGNWPAPMAHSYRLGLVTWGYKVRIPVGTDISHRGCAYTMLQTVQRHGEYTAAHGIVRYSQGPFSKFQTW